MMRRNKNCIKFEHFGLPRQRHLSPPVLRWRVNGILVPLQDETSGSVLWLVMSEMFKQSIEYSAMPVLNKQLGGRQI